MGWRGIGALAVAAIVAASGGAAQERPPLSPSADVDPIALPLAFEPNRGQTHASVRFLARTAGGTVFLTRGAAVLADEAGVVRMQLVGARRAEPRGQARLLGRVNYLRGRDPADWVTNVPTFRRVVSPGVYRGIDLVWYGRAGRLEYDFVVAPQADPGRIALAFDGAEGLRLDARGDLMLGERIRQLRPSAYQLVDGTRRNVDARYVVDDAHVRIALGPYDRSRELVIDPQLVFSTYLGGATDQDVIVDVESTPTGVFVVGHTESTDFPTTRRAFQPADPDPAHWDVFVTKLNRAGSELVYSTYLGGDAEEFGLGLKTDSSGNAYVSGNTFSTDFPTSPNAFQRDDPDAGRQDAFVAKLDSTGSSILYSTYLGGAGDESAREVHLAGVRAFVVGTTSSLDFPTTPDAFQPVDPDPNPESFDAFVSVLNANGSSLVYSTYLGGGRDDLGGDISVHNRRAYVVGQTNSADFPTTRRAFQPVDPDFGDFDGFVSAFEEDGSSLVFSTYLGGSSVEGARDVALDTEGNIYVSGVTLSPDFPTTGGSYQETDPDLDGRDLYVTQLNARGSRLIFSTYLGGSEDEGGGSVALSENLSVLVAGHTLSPDFPTTAGAFQREDPEPGGLDGLVARLNRHGAALLYATYLGGNGLDVLNGLDAATKGAVIIGGWGHSTDFPTTPDAFQPTDPNPDPFQPDGYVTKLNPQR